MPASNRIIVCFDGTWQSSVSGLANVPSNVTRLARHLSCNHKDTEGQEWNQIVYYDSGVGTGDIGLQTVIQGATGRGFETNVIEAYNFIVLNYKPGDKVYCFGFSRGAYTARAVAGLVTDIGIIRAKDMQDFPALYKLYRKNKEGADFRKTEHYYEWTNSVMSKDLAVKDGKMPKEIENIMSDTRLPDVPKPETRIVEVVGVFDTVGSLGIPDIQGLDMSYFRRPYGFHNVKLSPFIKNAFHALAIDEHRGPFTPTLWYIPYEQTTNITFSQTYEADYKTQYEKAKTKEEKVKAFATYMEAHEADAIKDIKGKQRLYQVWFPGMHINIGGGSDDALTDKTGDLEQIANISFCWMAELLRPHLKLDMNSAEIFTQERNAAMVRASSKKNFGSSRSVSSLNRALEYAHLKKISTYDIHDRVKHGWATGDIQDSCGGMMRLAGSIRRHPGQCLEDKHKQPLSQLGKTWEYIHPCVKYRMNKLQDSRNPYHPKAMKGYERKTLEQGSGNVGFEWVKKGGGWNWDDSAKKVVRSDVKVREWVIFPTKEAFCDQSFERAAMTKDALEWVKTLDNVYENTDWWKRAQIKNAK